jgi:transmembrane sensor
MGQSQTPANGNIPRKASEWLVALNEDPDNASLRAQFDAWLAESRAHATDWAQISRTFTVLGHIQPADRRTPGAATAARRQATRNRQRGSTIRRVGRRIALGVTALAACVLLAFAAPDLILRLQASQFTASGEQRTVHLPDGSTIQLAPQSAIQVLYSASARRVRLLNGEAFFQVAHDAARPFTVGAGGLETTDLGTEFNLRSRMDETDIAVRQGLVRVDGADKQLSLCQRLAAGQWLRLDHGKIEQGTSVAQEIGAWTRGQLIAKDRSVADIVARLRPYYKGIIVIRGAEFARQSVTGVYNLSDPVEALRALARAEGASVHRITPWLVVLSGA